MGLSSNSIIHLTNSADSLKGILQNNFKIKYCKELIELTSSSYHYAAPMVSFCDIPLSEIKNHISKYGTYGIGLTKEWAQRMNLNPVLYLDQNSNLSNSYSRLYENIFTEEKTTDELNEIEKSLVDLLRYIKNYEADLVRNDEILKKYRFSDEREWRFCPTYEICEELIMDISEYDTDEKKEKHNKQIKKLRLDFEPNDIKYIIIERESEISEFVEILKKSKGNKYSYNDLERLMTRIITSEQLLTDF